MDLREVANSPIHNDTLDAETLHAHSHDPTDDGAVLPGWLFDYYDCAGLGAVDPMLPCWEGVGFGCGFWWARGFGDEFYG